MYILIDTNGTPFLFRSRKLAVEFMKECYGNDITYVDTINCKENWIWNSNQEYMTLTKCKVIK